MDKDTNIKVIFVQGPTASGKTSFAIEMAERFGGEIISCDSIQVYKEVEIGTAKPNSKELSRVKHHMVSIINAPEKMTAGDFRVEALKIIEDRSKEGIKIFWVAGGTGFYFQALEKGMFDAGKVDEEISIKVRTDLEKLGNEVLYSELEIADPEYAKKIAVNDSYRICRAIELIRSGKAKPSEMQSNFKADNFPFPLFKICLTVDREYLRSRVELRTQQMLDSGLIEEVKSLIARGLEEWAPMQSVGYKESQAFLAGEIASLDELKQQIINKTMQLAKRQRTWFQRDKDNYFLDVQSSKEAILLELDRFINKH